MKKLILIVGPSGVGKDTLLSNIQNKIEANFVTRYITRLPDKNESNFYLDNEAYEILHDNEFFISTWKAHKNSYAIPKNQIKSGLNIISISRGVIGDFEKEFDNVITIEITLSKEVLYKRLKGRGRENEDEIQKRLDRSYKTVEAKNLVQFSNDKTIEKSISSFIELLENLDWN